MRVAITGGTGFVGRYIVRHLTQLGYICRLWCRESSDRSGFQSMDENVRWVEGQLGEAAAAFRLVERCDAVVHAAWDRVSMGFQGVEGDVLACVQKNLIGTLQLIEEARAADVPRFILVSSCAVHDVILDDRPLDETHPLWPASHYGAHKAAIEKFVHSYGFGSGYPICAIRPPHVYGLAHPPAESKWYQLVREVVQGDTVTYGHGGKQVHAADVARGIELLLTAAAEVITGQVYNCFDRYISEFDVATLAKEISGSNAEIQGQQTAPKHQIVSDKFRGLGMEFGGEGRLRETISQLVEAVRKDQ